MSLRPGTAKTSIDNIVCLTETQKAIQVKVKGGMLTNWIPKSQIDDDSEVYAVGHEGTLIISKWIADQKEWKDEEH